MPLYTIPSGNETSLTYLLEYSNTITNGVFGVFLLISIFVVSYVVALKTELSGIKSLVIASFLTMIMSFIFSIINLVSADYVVFPIIIFAISMFVLFIKEGE